jgi:hypothetical protein
MCEFDEKSSSVSGHTLLSKKGTCKPETAVYIPQRLPSESKANVVNVILWMHGFYVNGYERIFPPSDKTKTLDENDDAALRESVLASKKDVILIAPYSGFVEHNTFKGRDDYYNKEAAFGAGKATEQYLTDVLTSLNYFPKTPPAKDAKSLDIANLYLVGHSGGGFGVLQAMKTLGKFETKLKECWGFDCIYEDGYLSAARKTPFYIYFGSGTSGKSYDLWVNAYGTPKTQSSKQPKPVLKNMHLAPAFDKPGIENDRTAFESVEDLQKIDKPSTGFEQLRKELDKLLDDEEQYKKSLSKGGKFFANMKTHYHIAGDLLGPRIAQSLP